MSGSVIGQLRELWASLQPGSYCGHSVKKVGDLAKNAAEEIECLTARVKELETAMRPCLTLVCHDKEDKEILDRVRTVLDAGARRESQLCPFCECRERYTNRAGTCVRCGAPEDLLNLRDLLLMPPWDALTKYLRERLRATS